MSHVAWKRFPTWDNTQNCESLVETMRVSKSSVEIRNFGPVSPWQWCIYHAWPCFSPSFPVAKVRTLSVTILGFVPDNACVNTHMRNRPTNKGFVILCVLWLDCKSGGQLCRILVGSILRWRICLLTWKSHWKFTKKVKCRIAGKFVVHQMKLQSQIKPFAMFH